MAEWNALNGAEILPGLIICAIPSARPLIILGDETIKRRKGKKIKAMDIHDGGCSLFQSERALVPL